MGKKLRDLITDEGRQAELLEATAQDEPLPSHVKVSRPGMARSKVLQVRLNPEELEALERFAAERDLPVSTVARSAIMRYLNPPKDVDAVRLVDEFSRFLANR